ncbi:hypothetical protein CKM354_000869100 [Cercospora kikuchii]|uniref:Uncharacterized protein n=1 Tax=Cercospora kikuchii TaxID=84275 RepID=A0A9P3CMH7_9PEZI|nr:uncharacterized protein CKM354_000869100 [Cercospora kikuchii]GIZ45529.1 hypothetical protein CKM354_000869100 [Cercospora kikuchii]
MSDRRRAVRLRLQVQIAQEAVVNSLHIFDGSRKKFMDALQPTPREDPDALSPAQQLDLDEKSLRQTIAELHKCYNEMSNLDSQLLKEDADVAGVSESDYAQILLEAGQIVAPVVRTGLEATYDDDESDPEVPPILKSYFDTVAEWRLAQERLVDELPVEHAEQRLQRQRMIDQDKSVPETDEEFEKNCRKEYQDVVDEVDTLRRRVNELHVEVTNAGLDPDPNRWRRKSRSETSKGGTSLGVSNWLNGIEDAVDVPHEYHEDVRSLAGSTKTSRPESPSRPSDMPEEMDTQVEVHHKMVLPVVYPSNVRETATGEDHGLDQSSAMHRVKDEAPAQTLASSMRNPQSFEREASELTGVLLSPQPSRLGSPQPSDMATYGSDDHGKDFGGAPEQELSPAQSAAGSIRGMAFQRIGSHTMIANIDHQMSSVQNAVPPSSSAIDAANPPTSPR